MASLVNGTSGTSTPDNASSAAFMPGSVKQSARPPVNAAGKNSDATRKSANSPSNGAQRYETFLSLTLYAPPCQVPYTLAERFHISAAFSPCCSNSLHTDWSVDTDDYTIIDSSILYHSLFIMTVSICSTNQTDHGFTGITRPQMHGRLG